MTLRHTVETLVAMWKIGHQSRAAVKAALGPNFFYAEGKTRAFRNIGNKVQVAKGLSFFAIRHMGKLGQKLARWENCNELTLMRNNFPVPQRQFILELLHHM